VLLGELEVYRIRVAGRHLARIFGCLLLDLFWVFFPVTFSSDSDALNLSASGGTASTVKAVVE
jgi:hypothetical protein